MQIKKQAGSWGGLVPAGCSVAVARLPRPSAAEAPCHTGHPLPLPLQLRHLHLQAVGQGSERAAQLAGGLRRPAAVSCWPHEGGRRGRPACRAHVQAVGCRLCDAAALMACDGAALPLSTRCSDILGFRSPYFQPSPPLAAVLRCAPRGAGCSAAPPACSRCGLRLLLPLPQPAFWLFRPHAQLLSWWQCSIMHRSLQLVHHCFVFCRDQGFLYDSSLSAANWTQRPYPLAGSACASPDKCGGWSSVARVW